ncbi:MAG: hypothetical protein ACRDRJ_03095 [Streptosporangiaceae bacterium]
MFGNGDPFGQQGNNVADTGRDLAGRIQAAQYNLAIQQQRRPVQATSILASMLGQFLANRFGR